MCEDKEGESKVLQYFGNMRHNLAAIDAFAKFVKVMMSRLLDTLLVLFVRCSSIA